MERSDIRDTIAVFV